MQQHLTTQPCNDFLKGRRRRRGPRRILRKSGISWRTRWFIAAHLEPEWLVHLSLFKASPSLQDLEKAQLELENQLGSERRESIRPKSANVQNASHTIPTQIEPKKPERNNALRRVKSTNDTGTQDLMQMCRYYADLYRF